MSAKRRTRRVFPVVIALILASTCWISAIALFMNAIWPEPTPEVDLMVRQGEFTLDPTGIQDGYFLAMRNPTNSGLKMRVTKDKIQYTYDLNNQGEYEIFPLQLGSGKYNVSLYRNVKGTKYAKDAEVTLDVQLTNEDAAFLVPSQYVHYTPESYAVLAAQQLCEGVESDEEKLEILTKFIVENFTYDHERARQQKTFYLGDANMCFETRKGLCQDYAVMLAAMLRTQGIPTKMVLGYAQNFYHAWNQVRIGDEYRLIDVTAELSSGVKNYGSYTPERYY